MDIGAAPIRVISLAGTDFKDRLTEIVFAGDLSVADREHHVPHVNPRFRNRPTAFDFHHYRSSGIAPSVDALCSGVR
jgi:hypothetical protein